MSVTSNGNGKSLWTAAGVCSGVVLALVSGIGAAIERGYSRDQASVHERLRQIDSGADSHGALVERVAHVEALAVANSQRIEAAFKELDSKLQRELALADQTLAESINNLDLRLQGEIAVSRDARREQIEEVRTRLDLIESLLREVREGRQ